jgi:hypothetical protein
MTFAYICMHASYAYTYIATYRRTFMYMRIYIHAYIYAYKYTHTHTHAHTYIHTHIHTYTYIHAQVHVDGLLWHAGAELTNWVKMKRRWSCCPQNEVYGTLADLQKIGCKAHMPTGG